MTPFFAVLALFTLVWATPASADPASLIIATFGITSTAGIIATNLAVGVVGTLIARRMQRKRAAKNKPSGIRTDVTTDGSSTPQTFVLGLYSTAGNFTTPMYAGGEADKMPNAYRYTIIDLSDKPITSIEKIWVNGDLITRDMLEDPNMATPSNYGTTLKNASDDVSKRYRDKLWVRFFDGTQTAAHAHLVDMFGSHKERPWNNTHIGKGVAYVVIRMKADQEVFRNGDPSFLFECKGVKLYDPRKDSTRGGSGTQRWNNPATWAYTTNPKVMQYNLFLGIPMEDGTTFGLNVDLNDLPLDDWTADMNKCDELKNGKKQYQAGYEVVIGTPEDGGMDPLDVIDELNEACDGDVADVGGVWYTRCGAPDLPVLSITDGDIIRTKDQDFTPFEGLNGRYNAVRVLYPNPASMWRSSEAPLRVDSDLEAKDGQRVVAKIDLNAVFEEEQAQRIAKSLIKDASRRRGHNIPLGPQHSWLKPFRTISWTSAKNGYNTKLFQIESLTTDPNTLVTAIGIRERDASDYDWSAGEFNPQPPTSTNKPQPVMVPIPGVAAYKYNILDGAGNPRRAGIRVVWDPEVPGVRALSIKVRIAYGGEIIHRQTISDLEAGEYKFTSGVLPNQDYEIAVRGLRRVTPWSQWYFVHTDDVRIGREDIDPFLEVPKRVGALPTTNTGEAFLVFEDRLYVWSDSKGAWVRANDTSELTGVLEETSFANDLTPPKIVTTLPTTGNWNGRTVVHDGRLKVWNSANSAWESKIAASGVEGQLTNAQIQDMAASKLTGQVVAGQIADAAITAAKLTAGLKAVEVLGALPGTPHVQGRMVLLTTDNKLYRNTGAGWTAAVSATDLTGTLTSAQIASLDAAKLTGTIVEARLASLDAAKLTGTINEARITGLAAAKITGTLTNAQIADVAAAKVTGQLADTQIAAVATSKLTGTISDAQIASLAAAKVSGQLTNAQIADLASTKLTGQITSTQITDSAVTTAKLAAGAVVAGKIAANAITANEIAAGAITTAKLAAGAVTANEIAANSIVASRLALMDVSKPFSEAFTSDLSLDEWINSNGSGEKVILDDTASIRGGKAMKVGNNSGNDQLWLRHRRMIPFDPTKLYRVEFRVKRTTGTGAIYAGWSGFNKDGVVVNTSGQNLFSGEHYHAAAGNNPGTTYASYVGYTRGHGSPGGTGGVMSNPATPGVMHADTRFISPMILVNYNGVAGETWIDYVEVEELTGTTLIEPNAITTDKLAANAVTANEVAANAITSAKIAAGAIVAGKIAAGAIVAADIASGTITATQLASGSITTAKLVAGAVTANELAAGAVVAGKIAAGAITASDIAASTITGAKIAGTTITAANIASGTITATQLAASSVTTTQLAANAVTAGKIAANAVTANEIAAGTITGAKIAATTITGSNLVSNTITATQLAANSVTASQIAAGAVAAGKIAANAVTANEIAAGAVTTAKISAEAVTANEVAANAITAAKIASDAITTAKLAAGAVTADKLAVKSIAARHIIATDWENLFADGTFESADASMYSGDGITSAGVYFANTGLHGGNALRFYRPDPATTASVTLKREYAAPVQAGETYYWSVRADNLGPSGTTTTAGFYLQFFLTDSAGNNVSTPYHVTNAGLAPGWNTFEGKITIPAGVSYCYWRVYNNPNNTNANANGVQIDSVVLRRANAAKLVVDGSIIADMIASNAITADKIAANAVTAAKINVTSLSAISANLGSIQVDTANIKNLAVETAKIGNYAVTNVGVAYSNSQVNASYQSWTFVAQTSVQMGPSGSFHVTGQADLRFGTGYEVIFRLLRDGSEVSRVTQHAQGSAVINYVDSGRVDGTSYLYRLEMFVTGGGGSIGASAVARFIKVQEFKK